MFIRRRFSNIFYRFNLTWLKSLVKDYYRLLILIIVILTAGLIFLESGILNISKIQTEWQGTTELNEEYINFEEFTDYLSQAKGTNILVFNIEEFSTEVIKKFPWIKSVEISKELPRTLVINIQSEVPMILLKQDNTYQLLSRSSKVLLEANYEQIAINSHFNTIPLLIFKDIDYNSGLLNFYIDYVLHFDEQLIAAEVAKPNSYTIYMQDKTVVLLSLEYDKYQAVFGTTTSVVDNVSNYSVLIKGLKSKKIRYTLIDMRFRDPVIK